MKKIKIFLIASLMAVLIPCNLFGQNVYDGIYIKTKTTHTGNHTVVDGYIIRDGSMDSVVISVKDLKSFNYIIKNVNNSSDMLNEALKKSISYNMYLLGNMHFYRSGKKGKQNAKTLEYALRNYSDSINIFQKKSSEFNKIALSRYDSLAEKKDLVHPR